MLFYILIGGSRSTTEDIGLTKVDGECKSLQDKNTSETKKGEKLKDVFSVTFYYTLIFEIFASLPLQLLLIHL